VAFYHKILDKTKIKNKAILFVLRLTTDDVDKLIEIKKIKKIKA
jgi:hypothetical protein